MGEARRGLCLLFWVERADTGPRPREQKGTPKITIDDMVERCTNGRLTARLLPTSPRSVQACLNLGVDPVELLKQPREFFQEPGLPEELEIMKVEKYEEMRMQKLNRVLEERQKLENFGSKEASGSGLKMQAQKPSMKPDTSNMVESERKRLEAVKKRQEKEIQQMAAYEQKRAEIQAKAQKKQEEQAEKEAQKLHMKQQKEREWQLSIRERELKRQKEEMKAEQQARLKAAQAYKQEMEAKHREVQANLELKRLAFIRDKERREKAEASRLSTERILKDQQRVIERKQQEMAKKEAERLKSLAIARKKRQLENEIKRQKADERLKAALDANQIIQEKKRTEYEIKNANQERKRMERELAKQKADEERKRAEQQKNQQREEKFKEAQRREQHRINDILQKQRDHDIMQEQSQAERALMLSKKKLERDFDTQERQDKVASMKRMRAYQKEKMLGKIQADTQKALRLKAEKQQLQEERKQQNMIASHQKQKLMETMERMKTSKGWAALSKGGGPSRSRTSSAYHEHWRGQKNRLAHIHWEQPAPGGGQHVDIPAAPLPGRSQGLQGAQP